MGIKPLTSRFVLGAAALLCLAPIAAKADHNEYVGRTGLPTVLEGKGNIWLERGLVTLEPKGGDMVVTQEFRMHYPGTKLEKGDQICKVAIREDYFRSKDHVPGKIGESDAKGFSNFGIWIDDQAIQTNLEPWKINEKRDTATRWRTFRIDFLPGEVHTLKVVSVAPLGWKGDRRTMEFIGKDIGGWRDKPDYLEITVKAPSESQAKLVGLEPKPSNEGENGVKWVYRKADPNRDIRIVLPADYDAGR
jgi:hypothetical protein